MSNTLASTPTIKDFIALANQLRDDLNRHMRPFVIGAEAARQDGGYTPDVRASLRRAFPDEPADIIEDAIPAYWHACERVGRRSRNPGDWMAWGVRAARALAFQPEVTRADLLHALRGELEVYPDEEQTRVIAQAEASCAAERERLQVLLDLTTQPRPPGRIGRALARLIERPGQKFRGLVDISLNNHDAYEQAEQLGRRAARFYRCHPGHEWRRWIDGDGLLHLEVVRLWEDEE